MATQLKRAAAVSRPVPEAPAPEAPPSYTWYGCDLRTGAIVEEVPFVPGGPLQKILGAYSALQGTIAISEAAGDWESATDPGRTMLVCVRDEDDYPVWAGIVISRAGGSDDTIGLGLVTLEGYLDRRYVSNRTETNKGGAQIALDLVFDADHIEGIGLTYLGYTTGFFHDRVYTDVSDQTVYSQLSELMGVQNGPEWTIEIFWTDSLKTGFTKRFRTEKTIGGGDILNPSAVFDLPGSIRDYTLTEDFTSGRGANHITYYGDGEGETRPTGDTARATDLLTAGWPRYEFRKTIAGATEETTLTGHADEALKWMASGASIFTVDANAASGPKLGVDWILGSYVGIDVTYSPRHPTGFSILARAIGWELDTLGGIVTPLLEEEEID